jgi:uncharacterized membrane protein YheB (UPF0754 family)
MNAPAFSDPWTTAGGEAPFFYSNHQIWLTKIAAIKKRDLEIGTETQAKLKKNSITGNLRKATFEIFNDFGIDDVGSVVDWLVQEGWWKKQGHDIQAKELIGSDRVNRAELIRYIEREELEKELAEIAHEAWMDFEEEALEDLKDRKRKYE